MTTLTDVVAAVVLHSSAVAFSHFGVQLDMPQAEKPQPAAERVIARTPQRKAVSKLTSDCPDSRPHALKA